MLVCGCSSPFLWMHCVLALLLLVMAVAFMAHFSNNILLDYDEEVFSVYYRVGGGEL